MDFQKNYPNLFQFFNGYFADAALDDLSDSEITRRYIDDCSNDEYLNTKNELQILIKSNEYYWKTVSNEANRYFENEEASLKWLKAVQDQFK